MSRHKQESTINVLTTTHKEQLSAINNPKSLKAREDEKWNQIKHKAEQMQHLNCQNCEISQSSFCQNYHHLQHHRSVNNFSSTYEIRKIDRFNDMQNIVIKPTEALKHSDGIQLVPKSTILKKKLKPFDRLIRRQTNTAPIQ